MDWESAPAFGRRSTLLEALQRLHALQPGSACLVETGTLRDDSPQARDGDGWSTVAFVWYAQQTGGRVYTVDIDPAALETCRRLTAPYAAHIEYVCADSLAFLRDWNVEARGPIDLLYLDSLDYHDAAASEAHQLAETQAALPALAPACLVLLDDTHPAGAPGPDGVPPLRGKGALAAPFLLGQGFRLEECAGGQVLLSRNGWKGDYHHRGTEAQRKAGEEEGGGQKASGGSLRRRSDRSNVSDGFPLPLGRGPGGRSAVDAVPLCEVGRHFETTCRSPFMQEYLTTVLGLARAGRTCEVGVETGYGAIWLSRQGVEAEGISEDGRTVERARQVNNVLSGHARFRVGDLLQFSGLDESRPHHAPQAKAGDRRTRKAGRQTRKAGAASSAPTFTVVHHQGLLEHYAAPWVRAMLAQQAARADWVVFSVPSVYYPFEPEFGDERLLPLEEWRHLLADFEVADLRYYGDPQLGGREHILGVLRGAPNGATGLDSSFILHPSSFPFGISAIVHTRNEARHIAECLKTLQG